MLDQGLSIFTFWYYMVFGSNNNNNNVEIFLNAFCVETSVKQINYSLSLQR